MSALGWVMLLVAVAFVPVGWTASALAARPGGRAGLTWFGVTFVLPALTWMVIAIVGGPDRDLGSFAYFVGYLASVAAIITGTVIARTVRSDRSPG